MPKAYWIVTYRSVKNTEAWGAYVKLAGPALTAAGGRYLVRNKPAKTYEAGINERVILIVFDSLENSCSLLLECLVALAGKPCKVVCRGTA